MKPYLLVLKLACLFGWVDDARWWWEALMIFFDFVKSAAHRMIVVVNWKELSFERRRICTSETNTTIFWMKCYHVLQIFKKHVCFLSFNLSFSIHMRPNEIVDEIGNANAQEFLYTSKRNLIAWVRMGIKTYRYMIYIHVSMLKALRIP